jgi:hypothetical protein
VELRHLAAALVALAAVAGPIAGCGGSDPGPRAAQSGGSVRQAKSSGSSQPEPSGGSGTLTIADVTYMPAALTVRPGVRITVVDHDGTGPRGHRRQGQDLRPREHRSRVLCDDLR